MMGRALDRIVAMPLLWAAIAAPSRAQEAAMPDGGAMPMDHGEMHHDRMDGMDADDRGTPSGKGMRMPGGALGSYPMVRDASGTSWQPDLSEHQGIHVSAGDWMLMGHAMLWGVYDTQSGPRGDDRFFVPGMVMGIARRNFGDDTLSFRAMLSPDPFMGKSGYPLLLATGETANGDEHLVDRQHPHDLFMEMSSTVSHAFGRDDSAFLYLGYPGEPALGPPAFMHRASGMDIVQAPITHHWLDSTHITFGVATAGFVHRDWKLEVSQFTGREPDQHRYDFDAAKFDSTSVRASYNPDPHWSLQMSWGHLKSPEQLEPDVNETRITASASYLFRWEQGRSFAATAAWGLKDLGDGDRLNAVLFEAEYKPSAAWTGFARAEWEQNREIDLAENKRSVGELTIGGIRDFDLSAHAKVGIGASYTRDFVPGSVTPDYGSHPHGVMIFTRLALE